MAYNSDNEVREELANIKKNNRGDSLVVSKIQSNGNVYVDIRNFFINKDGVLAPTSKGVRINAELLTDVLAAAVKCLELDEIMDLEESLKGIIDSDSLAVEDDTE